MKARHTVERDTDRIAQHVASIDVLRPDGSGGTGWPSNSTDANA
ncbi:hypothetical protein [Rhodococcus sp. KBS0724]|jgi:hypothetical protein|nr:hypothetical protein [Rhodococcus sp. KBS0724]